VGEVGGPSAVAGAAANNEAAIGWATAYDLSYVVGGQVGARVGGAALPPGAPVPDDGAVVGDEPAPALPLGVVVVQVGAACLLHPITLALAVRASGLAPYWPLAAEAGAEQVPHRRLRRLRWRSCCWQSGQRSGPQMRRRLQPMQWRSWFHPKVEPAPLRPGRAPLPMAAQEGEQDRRGAHVARAHAHDAGPRVGRHPDHRNMVEGGPGPGDA
jgi:hypothetical protein